MIKLFIDAIAMAAPGMPTWRSAETILTGNEVYQATPLDRYKPMLLPPNEQRRATSMVRLAFSVCEELFEGDSEAASKLPSVFASSGGDYQIIDQICRTLCENEHAISPTQFHNSVHNSAAGYWSIASHSTAASTSLSCHDFTFVAGLLEAATMALEAKTHVLLVVYDIATTEPLLQKRNIPIPFATAFLLTTEESPNSLANISINCCTKQTESKCLSAELETIRTQNPAARTLPLLELIARKQSGAIALSAPGNTTTQLLVDF